MFLIAVATMCTRNPCYFTFMRFGLLCNSLALFVLYMEWVLATINAVQCTRVFYFKHGVLHERE